MDTSAIECQCETARLGDERRARRAAQIVRVLARDPSLSFPRAFHDKAGLEAFYRFVNNDDVSYEPIIEALAEGTAERVRGRGEVLVVHDTTAFAFPIDVEGIGHLNGKATGFFGHVALAVSADSQHRPLGIVGLIPVVRRGRRRGAMSTRELAKVPADEKESRRWPDLIEMVEGRLAGQASAIHVADREADTYPLLSHLVERGERFVVRISRDRKVEEAAGELSYLRESMEKAAVVLERRVPISRRSPQYRENGLLRTAGRTERVARLAIAAKSIQFRQPVYWRGHTPPTLKINVVWVRELSPPAGEEPIDWMLATSEPIDTSAAIERVVDFYRGRWLIEELFKALKTGCEFEKRQLESIDALLTTLALLLPIACQLLDLRNLARSEPARRAEETLGATKLAVLRALLPRHKLPPDPSIRDAMLAIAALGGHLKNNGEPGWIVLGRGMEALVQAEAGWTAAARHFTGREM